MKKCLGKFNGWRLSYSECAEMKECMELRRANFKNQLLRQADKKQEVL